MTLIPSIHGSRCQMVPIVDAPVQEVTDDKKPCTETQVQSVTAKILWNGPGEHPGHLGT